MKINFFILYHINCKLGWPLWIMDWYYVSEGAPSGLSCFAFTFWPSWTDFMCVRRSPLWVALYIHIVGMGTFDFYALILCVPEDFLSEWLHIHIDCGQGSFWPALMDWFYVFLKVSSLSCFVFTLWAWELLTFMDWFCVSLQVMFMSWFVFTLWAWELLAFMDWFYVCLKTSFRSSFVITLWTLEL